jgi:hypothetical protein
MKYVTAHYSHPTREYDVLVENLKTSLARLGHDLIIKTIDKDPLQETWHSATHVHRWLCCFWKADVIEETLLEYKEDTLWLDADCLVKSPVDDILGEADFCLTMRRIREPRNFYDGYINNGVIGVKYSPQALEMVKQWKHFMIGGRSDQDSLALLCLEHYKFPEYKEDYFNINQAKVRVLKCDDYNNFYYEDNSRHTAKIIHVKGSDRPKHYNNLAREILGNEAKAFDFNMGIHCI